MKSNFNIIEDDFSNFDIPSWIPTWALYLTPATVPEGLRRSLTSRSEKKRIAEEKKKKLVTSAVALRVQEEERKIKMKNRNTVIAVVSSVSVLALAGIFYWSASKNQPS